MTVEQAIDTLFRADYTLVSSLSTTSALTSSSVIAQTANTITRESGSFITDGWTTGAKGYIADSGANNHALFTVTGTVAALTLTVTETLTAQTKAQCGACVLTKYSAMRLYWMTAPEVTTVPYLVYSLVDDTDQVLWFDVQNTGQARVQFDVVQANKATAIIYQVRTKLRNTHGTIGGLSVQRIIPSMLRQRYNADTLRYVFSADYIFEFSYD
jgi:hypothetical protein